ncbi:uncharacterized protein LOC144477765, partial [Augochlora pura]
AQEEIDPKQAEAMRLAKDLSTLFSINVSESLDCIHKSGITKECLRNLATSFNMVYGEIGDVESVRKASCGLICMAEKRGYIADGEIQLQTFMEDMFPRAPICTVRLVREALNLCKEEVPLDTEDCLTGYLFAKCVALRTRISNNQHCYRKSFLD